jgi:FAD:protein FMN transferase
LPPASNNVRRARPLLGTFVEITVAGAASCDMHAAVEAAFRAVAQVHGLMTFHDADSDIGRLNSGAWDRPVRVHAWTHAVLETALELHRRSAGAFDIAVAPVLQDMDLLPRLRSGRPVHSEATATTEAVELLTDQRVRFRHPALMIDLGGIAKGFAVDRAIDVLRAFDMPRGLVNAGGDLAAFGAEAETVYIRDPHDPRRLICGITIDNHALASSGPGFDPSWSASSSGLAIIDPSTRAPARAIVAATVRASSCMIADALTKVVMVAGSSAAPVLDHYRAGALAVAPGGAVQMTQDLQSAVCLAA